jgi:hypothetical protein
VTITADVEQTEVEVRCPVPKPLPGGGCRPGHLLMKLRLNGQVPSFVHPDNLIELACEDCKYFARTAGRPVRRVLHRYDLAGQLVSTLVVELAVFTDMTRSYYRVPVAERFWNQVDRRGFDDCWLFTGEARMGSASALADDNGYGSFGLNAGELELQGPRRRPRLAHRVAFRLIHGRWPVPMALHGCDVRLCCNAENPEHVHEGTARRNMEERSDRFRDPRQYGRRTEVEVLRLVQDGLNQNEIAAELGISYNAVSNVVFRVTRRHPYIAGLLVAELLVETCIVE